MKIKTMRIQPSLIYPPERKNQDITTKEKNNKVKTERTEENQNTQNKNEQNKQNDQKQRGDKAKHKEHEEKKPVYEDAKWQQNKINEANK